MIRDPELIKEVLETQGRKSKPYLVPDDGLDPLMNKWSPLAVDNPWMKQVLNDEHIQRTLPKLQKIHARAREYCHKVFTKHKPMEVFDVEDSFRSSAEMVMKCVGFGMNTQWDDEDIEKVRFVVKSVRRVFKPKWEKVSCFFHPDLAVNLEARLVPKELDKALRQLVTRLLAKGTRDNDNVFAWIISEMGDQVNEEQLLQQMFGFLIETYLYFTVVGPYACYHLAGNEDIQIRIREQIRDRFNFDQEAWTLRDVERLTVLKNVIIEATRMHPPLGCTARYVTEAFDLRWVKNSELSSATENCRLCKGDVVFISNQGVHVDKTLWSQAYRFYPDRWMNRNVRTETQCYRFIPLVSATATRFLEIALKISLATIIMAGEVKLDPHVQGNIVYHEFSYPTRAKGPFGLRIIGTGYFDREFTLPEPELKFNFENSIH